MGKGLLGHAAVIAPRSYWGKYLEYRKLHPSDDFVLIDLPGLEDSLSNRFSDKALLELLIEGYPLEVAKEMLSAMKFFRPGKHYLGEGEGKLEELVPVFEMLTKKRLYKNDILPLEQFKSRDIVIAGYGSGERISSLLRDLPNISMSFDLDEGNALIEDPETKAKSSLISGKLLPTIKEFPDAIAGFHYLANRIADLLAHGVKPNDIVLLNYSSEFDFFLRSSAEFYNLLIQLGSFEPLANAPIGKKALNFLKGQAGSNAKQAIGALQAKLGEKGNEVLGQIAFLSDERLSGQSLYYAARKILDQAKAKGKEYEEAITASSSWIVPPGKKGFFLDFSLNHAPKSMKLGHILDSDHLLKAAGFMGLEEAEKQSEQDLIRALRSPDIVDFLYFRTVNGSARYESPLISKLNLMHCAPDPLDYEYSKSFAKIEAAEADENERKYKIPSARLASLLKGLGSIENYGNAYNGHMGKGAVPKTSYSALEEYIQCPFSYYCQRKLGLYGPDSYASAKGTAMHAYLEKEGGEEGEEAFDEAVKKSNYQWSSAEMLLLAFAKEDVAYYADEFYSNIEGEKEHEVKFGLRLDDACLLTGKVDLLSKLGSGYYIVDFKSSQAQAFIPERLQFGLSLQLPLYYLLTSGSGYGECLGSFIASTKRERGMGDVSDKPESLSKFSGFYLYDPDRLSALDPNLTFLPVGKDKDVKKLDRRKGAYGEQEFFEFSQKAFDIAVSAKHKIEDGQFAVSPLVIYGGSSKKVDPCRYCPFISICHKRWEDERAYRETKDRKTGICAYAAMGQSDFRQFEEDEGDDADGDE